MSHPIYKANKPCPACSMYRRVLLESDGIIHCLDCGTPIPEELNAIFSAEDKAFLRDLKVTL